MVMKKRTLLLVAALTISTTADNAISDNTNRLETAQTPKSRRDRFPSIDERIQLYMSNWYAPPCSESDLFPYRPMGRDSIQIANTTYGSDVIPDQAFWVLDEVITDCARTDFTKKLDTDGKIQFRQNMRMYCADVLEMVDLVHHIQQPSLPLLVQFGDMKHSHVYGDLEIPLIKKFRSGTDQLPKVLERECYSRSSRRALSTFHSTNVLQPIVWKLATHRHYRNLMRVYRHDTEWAHKLPVAVWRGQLTGALDGFDKAKSPFDNCMNMNRCRLVYESGNSTIVQAKLTTTRNRLPSSIHGREIVGPSVTIRELMRHKALIMLEGNDVASGLKWALLSQSVVLMPPPKHTSWAMEELLQPWVHYVPLKEDASDAERMMQWVLNHDDQAKRISERATLWMEDLCFHPDAAREDRLIMEEMLKRYSAHFVEVK
jgi:hypothetical protein